MGRAFQNRKESMAKTAGMKTKLYSKYGKEIYVCAKNGGIDPDGNLSLRRMIDKAKKDQVPGHVIDKAIEKAKGGSGEDYVAARYEGFGPGNTMVIVDCLTDNNNRTYGDVRTCFNKAKSKIGAQGAVSHLFDHVAVFAFQSDDEEAVLEALMMEDIDVSEIENEDGMITVMVPPNEFHQAKTALESNFEGINFEMDEITFLPQMTTEISGDEKEMFEKLVDMLNDCEDVQNVYHNAEFV
ncbi:YebC/PmpR family DNA-binding transcriptional regulator [Litoribrevibacter albus]|uniref:Probable transcriptional regulatory protein GCM10007876_12940 n=1 Tax=Litoribrevibacter albus TaxID=1473156 RepID=A0AA37S9M7_9GAMM|nr:YebC/PmpR family DNA-binding transcriptional regulator [Litoribrevibacter albus]GLQ30815.1 putative transcriptional regulatory protein [Litoribrevibacter albus]